eukprot:CAMPEP_0205909990 /NCGR_PEP_ID=MMETSP1325-20131115/4195_1 /ASSEMBLY_ACC=CAM_ASM_000708 /TAXON_ID=236786 /ORGANISM="Florenciella sp., Strain RCC1007" /LENGTH=66 /DNA_ID=CAMNT_0053276319 /DNA_START=22 /DNA_END=222 /DNA_ORIENTATION=+
MCESVMRVAICATCPQPHVESHVNQCSTCDSTYVACGVLTQPGPLPAASSVKPASRRSAACLIGSG